MNHLISDIVAAVMRQILPMFEHIEHRLNTIMALLEDSVNGENVNGDNTNNDNTNNDNTNNDNINKEKAWEEAWEEARKKQGLDIDEAKKYILIDYSLGDKKDYVLEKLPSPSTAEDTSKEIKKSKKCNVLQNSNELKLLEEKDGNKRPKNERSSETSCPSIVSSNSNNMKSLSKKKKYKKIKIKRPFVKKSSANDSQDCSKGSKTLKKVDSKEEIGQSVSEKEKPVIKLTNSNTQKATSEKFYRLDFSTSKKINENEGLVKNGKAKSQYHSKAILRGKKLLKNQEVTSESRTKVQGQYIRSINNNGPRNNFKSKSLKKYIVPDTVPVAPEKNNSPLESSVEKIVSKPKSRKRPLRVKVKRPSKAFVERSASKPKNLSSPLEPRRPLRVKVKRPASKQQNLFSPLEPSAERSASNLSSTKEKALKHKAKIKGEGAKTRQVASKAPASMPSTKTQLSASVKPDLEPATCQPSDVKQKSKCRDALFEEKAGRKKNMSASKKPVIPDGSSDKTKRFLGLVEEAEKRKPSNAKEFPSKRRKLTGWQSKQREKWNGFDLLGYWLDKWAKYYGQEDPLFVGEPFSMQAKGNVFKNAFWTLNWFKKNRNSNSCVECANYIDWLFNQFLPNASWFTSPLGFFSVFKRASNNTFFVRYKQRGIEVKRERKLKLQEGEWHTWGFVPYQD